MTADERAFLVDARPEPVRLKTNQTAVLVVDMQNDFASPGGMFDLAGIDISSVQAIVEPIATVLGAARAVGIPVFYLKMGFRPDLRDAGDGVLYKHRYSGFFGTDLDARLRAEHVDTLVVVGATTSVCVESTVRDAMFRDYHCLVLEDCTAEPIAENTSRSNHEASLTVLELLFGSVAKSSALIDSLERM
jgi:ureidoacrylate peracid hydrolase